MIYNIQTFCTYGYWPEDLKPHSGKPIIVACDRCGKIRIMTKNGYHDLCISCSQKRRYEDPEERKKTSNAGLDYYKNNPMLDELKKRRGKALSDRYKKDPVSNETRKQQSKAQQKRFEDPKEREKTSRATLKAYRDDPTIIDRITESVNCHYDEMDDPGQEIISHHYIYDFNDLNNYTIPVTRSEHTSIHWNLKRAGLEVPCINIMRDDYYE